MKKEEKFSSSLEDYVEAIAEIIKINGHAHTKDIANRLNVKMPSVTKALQLLAKNGLIIYKSHQPVELTPKGEKLSSKVIRRHQILDTFFFDIINLPQETASENACQIEHIINDLAIDRFGIISEALKKRTDCKKVRQYIIEAFSFSLEDGDFCVLSNSPIGSKAEIIRFGENLKNISKLEDKGIKIGEIIRLFEINEEREIIRLRLNDDSLIQLTLNEAENIWLKIL